ncbi:MAG: hypothetical protein ACK559_02330, partial [bacterium]
MVTECLPDALSPATVLEAASPAMLAGMAAVTMASAAGISWLDHHPPLHLLHVRGLARLLLLLWGLV